MPGGHANQRPQQGIAEGFNQATGQRTQHVPSMADGCTPTALVNSLTNSASASPGGVLGTGQNPDRYTPACEAV